MYSPTAGVKMIGEIVATAGTDKYLDNDSDDKYKLYDSRSDDEDKHYDSESENEGNQSDKNKSGSETESVDSNPEYKLVGDTRQSYGWTDDEVEEDNNATNYNEKFMEDMYSEMERNE